MTDWTAQTQAVRESTPLEKLEQDAASLSEAASILATRTSHLLEARSGLADAEGQFAAAWDAWTVRNRIHAELMEELRATPDNLPSVPKSVR